MYIGLHIKCPIFLPDINQISVSSTGFHSSPQNQIPHKTVQWRYMWTDRMTAWYSFNWKEHFCGDIISPATIKHTFVFMWSVFFQSWNVILTSLLPPTSLPPVPKFPAVKLLTEFKICPITPNYQQFKSPLFPDKEGYVNTIQGVVCVGSWQWINLLPSSLQLTKHKILSLPKYKVNLLTIFSFQENTCSYQPDF